MCRCLQVPVGGAIVAGDRDVVDSVSRVYPGRASMAPILDLFITLLSMVRSHKWLIAAVRIEAGRYPVSPMRSTVFSPSCLVNRTIAPHLDARSIIETPQGVTGYKALLAQRKDVAAYLREQLGALASRHGERLLASPHNPISFAMSVDVITQRSAASPLPRVVLPALPTVPASSPSAAAAASAGSTDAHWDASPSRTSGGIPARLFAAAVEPAAVAAAPSTVTAAPSAVLSLSEAAPQPRAVAPTTDPDDGGGGALSDSSASSQAGSVGSSSRRRGAGGPPETYFGSMLFSRGVSGTRVVSPASVKTIDKYKFVGYGAQCNAYPCAYVTAAAGIGMTRADVDTFIERVEKTIAEFKRQESARSEARTASGSIDQLSVDGSGAVASPERHEGDLHDAPNGGAGALRPLP